MYKKYSLLLLFLFFYCFNADAQTVTNKKPDILMMKDGTKIEVYVIEIDEKTVLYHKVSSPQTISYRINKSDAKYLQLANGEIEVFPVTLPPPINNLTNSSSSTTVQQSSNKPYFNQDGKPLSVYTGFFGPRVVKEGVTISKAEVLATLSKTPQAYAKYKSGKGLVTAGLILSGVGGGLLGWGLALDKYNYYYTYSYYTGNIYYYSETNSTKTYALVSGGALAIAGLLMNVGGNKKISEGINLYNSSLSHASIKNPVSVDFTFASSDRIGLLVNF
jgi:hypothetical protein